MSKSVLVGGNKWIRVTGFKASGPAVTNAEFAKTNQQLIDACDKVGIKPTARQASKWKLKKGKAYLEGRFL